MAAIGYGYGSEWHLLQYFGRRRGDLTRRVEERIGCSGIVWSDCEIITSNGRQRLREVKGVEFLAERDPVRLVWEAEWPQTGNVHNWDAVGVSGDRGGRQTWVLVEGKAHVGELASSCGAGAESLKRIRKILDTTRHEIGTTGTGDWTKGFYQYCNRIALLHYLMQRGIDAHLLFVYFTGDRTDLGRAGRVCPKTQAEWGEVLASQKQLAGIPDGAPITARMHSLFLPVLSVDIAEEVFRPEYRRSTPA